MPLLPAFYRKTVPAKDGASWPHVVVVGGGFAGAHLVLALRDARVRVTLIDRNVYKTFQPLLYQVATAGLNSGDVTMFLRGLSLHAPNMRFRQGEVTGIDTDDQVVKLSDGGSVRYDHLVLANGATTNYFGTPGAEEFAMPMYTRSQALEIRERIFAELERATQLTEMSFTDRLAISIVGGGPTGVEIAGALADFRISELDVLYPEVDPGTLEISLIQRGDELLKAFEPQHREYAARELEKRGVTLRLGQGVEEVGYDFVRLADGSYVESDITIWAAGVSVSTSVNAWGLPQGRGGESMSTPPFASRAMTTCGPRVISPVAMIHSRSSLNRPCKWASTWPARLRRSSRAMTPLHKSRSATTTWGRWRRSVGAPLSRNCQEA